MAAENEKNGHESHDIHKQHNHQPNTAENGASSKASSSAGSVQSKDSKHTPHDDKDMRIEELTDTAKRVQADFENYKKRTEKEHENLLKTGKAMVIKRLLPVLDTFDHALKDNPDDEGLKRVHKQLWSVLEAEGLRPIKSVGEKLDPYRHECLAEEESCDNKGSIIEEIQRGYMLGEYVLRHALVKVSKGHGQHNKE